MVMMKMSWLNVTAFLSLFLLILVQDIIAPPPSVYDEYPAPDGLDERADYIRPWGRAEIEEKPTLPPDLLDVPLKVETNTTTSNRSDGSTTTTTRSPNVLPLDDPVEPNDTLMSTTTTTTKKPTDPSSRLFPEDTTTLDKADAEMSHPDSPLERSSSSYNYPEMVGQPVASYNPKSGSFYKDPILGAKLRQARLHLIDNFSYNDRSDIVSSRMEKPDPDFVDDYND